MKNRHKGFLLMAQYRQISVTILVLISTAIVLTGISFYFFSLMGGILTFSAFMLSFVAGSFLVLIQDQPLEAYKEGKKFNVLCELSDHSIYAVPLNDHYKQDGSVQHFPCREDGSSLLLVKEDFPSVYVLRLTANGEKELALLLG